MAYEEGVKNIMDIFLFKACIKIDLFLGDSEPHKFFILNPGPFDLLLKFLLESGLTLLHLLLLLTYIILIMQRFRNYKQQILYLQHASHAHAFPQRLFEDFRDEFLGVDVELW